VKQAIRNMLILSRDYAQKLPLLVKRPRLVEEFPAGGQQIERLKSRLERERQEVKRLNREVRRLKLLVGRPPVGEVRLLRRLDPISSRSTDTTSRTSSPAI
jgi:predicted RNase H-like nuclease (RuvC/YqgF family)